MADRVELPTTERAERCDRCRWWVPDYDDEPPAVGGCRRSPPTLLPHTARSQGEMTADDETVAHSASYFESHTACVWGFPVTRAETFCGEFAAGPS